MTQQQHDVFLQTLERELIPALGCTEPIAIAYAAAKARQVLGEMPRGIRLRCSGNIIKNVRGVAVPNAGGLRGVEAAAILGVVGGDADRELEVLQAVTPRHLELTRQLLEEHFCTCSLQENVANLYIVAEVFSEGHTASVTIINRHTLITRIEKDGRELFRQDPVTQKSDDTDWSGWSVAAIVEFAETVDISRVRALLDGQIDLNGTISNAGLRRPFGAQIGRTLLDVCEDTVWTRAKARAAAGSDARMGGCSLPVVINSGSGNQGITVSLPVMEYAAELKVPREKLYRALIISNLISIFQKHYIGSLSAFCGAVTAAAGCGAAITWLHCGTLENICDTIANTVANVGGMVCDGAKASCAAKIASAVDAAIMAHHLSMRGLHFQPGEGIIQDDPQKTIRSLGYIGRVGMRSTDAEILNLMLGNVDLDRR
ncbi:MAG: L-serine ammonia-lyase, iron-sulfur-dependent, subunit alpha [Clostridia bacterium]|nr:L-serine ammonia-lyase, iron-sulfur-dependent, subunit alpha [Clostridia bacterium]